MKYIIHYGFEDELIIEGDTIEEVREIAFREEDRRGWDRSKCWSERIDSGEE